MENKNDLGKESAFPIHPDCVMGMDLRTYIATKCVAGLLSTDFVLVSAEDDARKRGVGTATILAELAVVQADALIAELSKNT